MTDNDTIERRVQVVQKSNNLHRHASRRDFSEADNVTKVNGHHIKIFRFDTIPTKDAGSHRLWKNRGKKKKKKDMENGKKK